MRAERFLDTNILVYAFTQGDPRCAPAEAILIEGGCISVQVLNELVRVLSGKLLADWPTIRAQMDIAANLLAAPAPLTVETHRAALTIAERHQVRIYDALMVASALEQGCTELLSEDLQHGRHFGALSVRNPFIADMS
jgi:predicted nucleic acid-binding protein